MTLVKFGGIVYERQADGTLVPATPEATVETVEVNGKTRNPLDYIFD